MDTTKRENQLTPEKLSLPTATMSLLSSLTSESKNKFLKDSFFSIYAFLSRDDDNPRRVN